MSIVLIIKCEDCDRTIKIVHIKKRDIDKISEQFNTRCHHCE